MVLHKTKTTNGILYLVLCFTLVPALLGVIDGIRILAMTDARFRDIATRSRHVNELYAEVAAVLRDDPSRLVWGSRMPERAVPDR